MKTNILCFLSFFFIISCNNDDSNVINTNTEVKIKENNEKTFVFFYENKRYTSEIISKNIEGQPMVLKDKLVSNTYKQLQKNETLSALMDENGNLFYFDSHELLDKYVRNKYQNTITPPVDELNIVGNLTLYDVKNHFGLSQQFEMPHSGLFIPNLNSFSFDNLTSSVKVESDLPSYFYLTLYRNPNYGGPNISWVVADYNLNIYDLKDYFFITNAIFTNWSDQVSSVKALAMY